MKSKRSLRNLARFGLLLSLSIPFLYIFGCTPSTAPTYLIEDIPRSIQDICKSEYKIDCIVTLVGQTLWIYIPVEDIFIKSKKPEKYIEKFTVEENNVAFEDSFLRLNYKIDVIPEEEKFQEYTYNKSVQDKINNVWQVLRRVIFSLEREKKGEPKFFCIVTADIKNSFETKDLIYYLDLKKVSYGFISWGEYYHRVVNEMNVSEDILADTQGKHLEYKDFTFAEFILEQIKYRIKLKFQKPEVDKGADIDKEITKAAIDTIKIYGFKDFEAIELYNSLTRNRIILNKAAVLAGSISE